MTAVTIVPAEAEHIGMLAPLMRSADVAEVEMAGLPPRKALWRSYRKSVMARTAFVDGEIAAMWGVGGCPLGRVGEPWLLTAPAAERAVFTLVRQGHADVAAMLGVFPELRGKVASRYTRAIRLLEGLGFSLSEEFPFGPERAPFREYRLSR